MRRQQGRPSVPGVGRGGRSTCSPCLIRGDRGRPDTCRGAFSHRDLGRLSVARDRVEPLDRRVMADVLDRFSPATAAWFRSSFAAPTTAQRGAWEAISSGQHTLVVAPTGSGKTLSAFLWAIDKLVTTPPDPERSACRVLYVSPLKALATDVERNLRSPLVGIGHASTRLGLSAPQITVADLGELGTSPAKDDPTAHASIWPHVEERIVDLIAAHRSTIVFANSRRLAERLTGRLNEVYAERIGEDAPLDSVRPPAQ